MKRLNKIFFASLGLLIAASAAAQELRPLEEMIKQPNAKDVEEYLVRCSALSGVLSERSDLEPDDRAYFKTSAELFFTFAAKVRLQKSGAKGEEGVKREEKVQVIDALFNETLDMSEQYSKRIKAHSGPLSETLENDPLLGGDTATCIVLVQQMAKKAQGVQ